LLGKPPLKAQNERKFFGGLGSLSPLATRMNMNQAFNRRCHCREIWHVEPLQQLWQFVR